MLHFDSNVCFREAAAQRMGIQPTAALGRQLQMAIATPKTPKHTDISASHAGT
ncbi:hypothetical protein [Pacificibacter marinus]|uniref:hypothetical protein n=1 Tax=Pacificibacter marinus TaxID=658057 RepID=UPI001C06B89D|nr:hypothetical protein [Pacificibacter marinus]MBU2866009.1 hypothetical protein [Pacificibacter marinus]